MSRKETTRSQRLRTLARFPAEVDFRDPPKTPIYQSIAPRVAAMHERGLCLNAVAKHLGVDDVRSGVELIVDYDSTREVFSGTVRNTTSAPVTQVRVEIHLSNGVELGPTPRVDLPAGETHSVELDARGQTFSWFTVHVEIGSGTA